MKFASLNTGRDGQLMLVSRDLQHWVDASTIAPNLQTALDHWEQLQGPLQARYDALNRGELGQAKLFDTRACASPLPRAYQWADGSAYVNHVELVRRARGAEIPVSFWHDPLMYQGGSDGFLAPQQDIVADPAWGIDFEAEIAVVTDDVPMQTDADDALDHIRLVMLVND
ncbi:MAG: fumarylacetoacetate hydrolase family protein, partial [Oceanococcus sp.]